MVARLDRDQWGDSSLQVNVQVNMPQLHLDALRARSIELQAHQQLPPAGEVDVEVLHNV
jgi:hypothetical protein